MRKSTNGRPLFQRSLVFTLGFTAMFAGESYAFRKNPKLLEQKKFFEVQIPTKDEIKESLQKNIDSGIKATTKFIKLHKLNMIDNAIRDAKSKATNYAKETFKIDIIGGNPIYKFNIIPKIIKTSQLIYKN